MTEASPGDNKESISRERRRFLKTALQGAAALTGVGALNAPGKAASLEFQRGMKWDVGYRKLRESATGTDEHLGLFAGERETGEWVHMSAGDGHGIDMSEAELGELALARGTREKIEKGLAIDHTHLDGDDELTILRDPFLSGMKLSREEIAALTLRPSTPDMQTAGAGLLERYFDLRGLAPKSLEWGTITVRGRWSLKTTEWTLAQKSAYPQAYERHLERDLQYQKAYGAFSQWLQAPSEAARVVTRSLFRTELGDWEKVARTPRLRAEIIAHAVLKGILLESADVREMLKQVPSEIRTEIRNYRRAASPRILEKQLGKLEEEVEKGGKKDFREYEDELAGIVRQEMGLELSWQGA
jgi:hypothetical protein